MSSRRFQIGTSLSRPLVASMFVVGVLMGPCVVPGLLAPARGGATHVIRGKIVCGLFGFGISGVKMYGLPGDPKTDGSGEYSATVPEGWSGAVYPLEDPLHFEPFGRNYVNVTSDIVHNYKTTLPAPAISGYVRTSLGQAIECVAMNGLPSTPLTNYHGFYLAYVDSGDSVTVTPQKAGYTFNPVSRVHHDVDDNLENQNYTGIGAPNFTVNPTSGLTTTEGGGTAVFTVVLIAPPTADVTIGISSGDASEGTASPSTLTFTPTNWNTPQAVTVTGVDDALRDGNVAYTIITSAAISADPNYHGLDPANVGVTNLDNDTPGITVSPTSGLVTTESGGTAQFTVVLNAPPAANVTIGIASGDNTEGVASPGSLTFTPANWSTPQTVTVTGLDDVGTDGDEPYTVLTGQAVSADPGYNGLKGANVSVTNLDNEGPPALSVTPTTTVVFPETEVGQTVDSPAFTVTNAGGGRLTGSATVSGVFSVVSGGTFDLASGASQVVGIRFAPTSGTTYTSTVSFTSNAGTASRSVRGTGTVYTVVVDNVDDEPGKRFEVVSGTWASDATRPNSWRGDYRTSPTGDGSSVAAWVFQVRQDGLYEVAAWWPGTLRTWASAAPFRVCHAMGNTTALRNQRYSGARWNILGKFQLWSGTDWRVELANNSAGATVVADAVRIKWVGNLAPRLYVSPSGTRYFGLTRVGSTRELDAYTVKNVGRTGRLVGQVDVPAPFSIVSGGTFTLLPGVSQVVRIAYAPAAEGSHIAAVDFTSNAGSAARAVRGTALITLPPLLLVEPAAQVDMGRVTLGSSTELDAFTVRNDGDQPLTGTAAASGVFRVVAGSPFTLAPGASQAVRLRFTPTSETRYSQAVSFASNGGKTRRRVLGQGTALVVDNLDNAADRRFAVLDGVWTPSSARPRYWASDYCFTPTGDGSSAAAWYFRVPSDGIYEVSVRWPYPTSTWGSAVPFTVYHRTGSNGFLKDQRSNGGRWNVLGRFEFTAANEWCVETANNSPGSFVIADAVRVKWTSALALPKVAAAPRVPAAQILPLGILATPDEGPAPLDVLLEATSVPAGAVCAWDFGDGTKAQGQAAIHTYSSPGLYVVTLAAGGQTARAAILVRDGALR